MLIELRVENLLLIERATLAPAPGLNVLTGETGAGKTVLAHALDLLLGGKARNGIVRPGAREAYVEGVFELDAGLRDRLGDRISEDAEDLVLARRVSAEGRTRAYVGGRSATAADLRELGSELLSFYGQHEHRRLTLASAQLEILDAFCGPGQAQRRADHAAAHAAAREAEAAVEELRELAGARERELGLLDFELDEIDGAEPSEAEEGDLDAERSRLRHLEGLRAASVGGAEALVPDSGGPGAVFLLAEGGARLEGVAGIDAELDGLAERWRSLRFEAEDLAAELRRYEQGVEGAPGRLEEVEERLSVFETLKRKHGGSLSAVLAHAEQCRARRDRLVGAEVAMEKAIAALAAADERREKIAAALSKGRRAAAPKLAKAVRARLTELAMESADFSVEIGAREEPGPAGRDTVEFLIAPNPGVPAGPLRDIASGGEVSRVMLALMSVAVEAGQAAGAKPAGAKGAGARAPGARLLVFDEVDAGIGGHTAHAVGERLRALASGHQVLCITHLPQVASLADRHFEIAKDTGTQTARTTVTELAPDEVVGELMRMLGADSGDLAARRHAQELLKAA
jgi:DNA repair protein RecN (Recombination protein N)